MAHPSVGEMLASCRKILFWCSVVRGCGCGCSIGGCCCCCVSCVVCCVLCVVCRVWCVCCVVCVCSSCVVVCVACCMLWCGLWRPFTEIHGYSCRLPALVLKFSPRCHSERCARPSKKNKKHERNKNNETSSCDQQCFMKCPEHNRSKKGTLREKNQDPTSMTVPQEKDDICNRPEITPQGIYLHYGFN